MTAAPDPDPATPDLTGVEHRLEPMRVADLVALGDPRNPKDHDIDGVCASLRRFGLAELVLLDERTGLLVAGHGRVEALDLMEGDPEQDPPRGVTTDGDGAWVVPVTRGWSSENDDEAGAYLIASNRLSEVGGWHLDPLTQLLAAVRDTTHGLDGVGYTPDSVDDLLASVAPPPDLDALADKHGESKPEDFWPVLRFKVPPAVKTRFATLTAEVAGGDAEAFDWLVTQAERAQLAARVHGTSDEG